MPIPRRRWLQAVVVGGASLVWPAGRAQARFRFAIGDAVGGAVAQGLGEILTAAVTVGMLVMVPFLMFAELLEKISVELGLTPEQERTLTGFSQSVFEDLGKATLDADPAKRREKLLTTLMGFENQFGIRVHGVLNPEQQRRWNQIVRQFQGPLAWQNDDVARELELTEEQRSKVAAIAARLRGRVLEPTPEGKLAGLKHFVSLVATRRASLQEAQALLDESQRERWQQMLGKPISLRAWLKLGDEK